MSNLKDININDINYFLKYRKIPVENDPYLTLWNFLISNKDKNILVPESVADWVIAYNARGKQIPSSIDNLSNDELESLALLLGLDIVNKTRIVRILLYIKLSLIDNLPEEIIIKILLSANCKDIPKMCQSSNKMRNICNDKFIPHLKDKLRENTKINVNNYNFQQLIYLCQQQKYRQYNKIAAGYSHTLIISDGKVYSCGKEGLGLGDIKEINELTQIPGLNNIIEVAAGSSHSLALDNDGKVYAFGDNKYGQLGLGDKNDRNVPTLIINLPKIINIAAAVNISALLTEDGQVYTFGQHIGPKNSRDDIVPILNNELKNIIQISVGNGYLLALDNNGKVYG